MPGDDVTAVGRHIQANIGRASGGAALKQRPQRPGVAHAILIEAKVVQKQDEGPRRFPKDGKQARQAGQFVDRALQQRDVLPFLLQLAHYGRDDGGFARAPRPPKQDVMGGMPGGMTARIVQQRLLLRIYAGQQCIIDRAERLDRVDGRSIPDIGGTCGKVCAGQWRRRNPLQSVGDAGQ